MICYGPRLTTIAAVGIVCYVFLHKTIGRIIEIAGLVLRVTLITVVLAAAAWLVIWTVRGIKRRRATMGACATCRFRCQQALHPGAPVPAGSPVRRGPAPRGVTVPTARPATAPAPWPDTAPAPAPSPAPALWPVTAPAARQAASAAARPVPVPAVPPRPARQHAEQPETPRPAGAPYLAA